MTLVDVVKNDLHWLATHFEHGTRDRDELRRASAVARRLLIDGSLQQAWKATGAEGQPTLKFYPLSQIVDLSDPSDVKLVVAAGCQIESRLLGPFSIGPQIQEVPSPPQVDSAPLPKFVKSACIVVDGHLITRGQVVKYVANKLGGVHFDASRGRRGDEYMQYLEGLDDLMTFRPLSVVDMMLLSIIQAAISSESVMSAFQLLPIAQELNVRFNSSKESLAFAKRARLDVDFTGDHSGS